MMIPRTPTIVYGYPLDAIGLQNEKNMRSTVDNGLVTRWHIGGVVGFIFADFADIEVLSNCTSKVPSTNLNAFTIH
jgi:hypothetical protein